MGRRFSIRYKFLAVTTLLLVLCVGAYLLMASRVFKSDKTQLVFDYNRSNVVNLSSELESFFLGVADKIQLVAVFFSERNDNRRPLIQDLVSNDSEIVFVAGSDRFIELDREFFVDSAFVETYALPKNYFKENLGHSRPIPFERIRLQGEAIWNATVTNGPALIGFGKSVVEEDEKGVPLRQYAVVAYLKADKLIKSLRQSQLSEVFVANRHGELLAHPDVARLSGEAVTQSKIVELAQTSKVRTSVVDYKEGGEHILGAYSHSYNNLLLVLSQISGERAFAVVDRLIYRSLMFAGIVLTLAFIVAILFSRSLTRPIEVLMGGMKQVADGDLETQIHVRSRDEIAVLANSFNAMIHDLKDSRYKLEEINRDLEKKVKERTLELEKQNQAVKQAQEALLRTTRLAAVGEIAGQAAHEVLNPLTSILSRVQKLKDRLQTQSQQELQLLKDIKGGWEKDYADGGFKKLVESWASPSSVNPQQSLWQEDLENIQRIGEQLNGELSQIQQDTEFLLREGQRINRIVNSMRSLSVVNAELKEQSAFQLVKQSVDIMADLASQHSIQIQIERNSENDLVAVDEDEFIQVLTNLLRNALQAIESVSSQHQGLVKVRIGNEEDRVLIEVEDNGPGIKEEIRHRLFETNFTTKSKREGTGLGLKISRRFIRAFHGDLFLKSSHEGQGSTFVISLPLANLNESKKKATA